MLSGDIDFSEVKCSLPFYRPPTTWDLHKLGRCCCLVWNNLPVERWSSLLQSMGNFFRLTRAYSLKEILIKLLKMIKIRDKVLHVCYLSFKLKPNRRKRFGKKDWKIDSVKWPIRFAHLRVQCLVLWRPINQNTLNIWTFWDFAFLVMLTTHSTANL